MLKVILSFDDGRGDNYFNAYKILKNNGLVASMHVTTGFIDGSYQTNDFGVGREPLTNDQIIEMYNDDFDISSHGDKHIMDPCDFDLSIKKLSNILGINSFGFSMPNSKGEESDILNFYNNCKNKPIYIRKGRNKKCYSFWGKMNYALYRVFKWQLFFNQFNRYNLISSLNKLSIDSLVVKNYQRESNLSRFIRKYKDRDYYLIIMFHSIVENPKNTWEWSLNKFSNFCSMLSKLKERKEICVTTLKEVCK